MKIDEGIISPELLAKFGPIERPEFCTKCGRNPPRDYNERLCLACAQAGCVMSSAKAFTTRSAGGFAVAEVKGAQDGGPSCPHCSGTQHIFGRENGYSYAKPCRGAGLSAALERFNAAKCPGIHHASTLANYETNLRQLAAYLDRAVQWCEDVGSRLVFSKGLRLQGSTGVGKTHLLVAMLKVLTIDHGIHGRYIDWGVLMRLIRQGIDMGKGRDEVLEPFRTAPVLMLDEVGKGEKKDWRMDVLEDLVESRYSDETVVTCVATNYSSDELDGRVGKRVSSRFKEMTTPIQMAAPDYRGR
jgi:DNA replication protein DnaC